MNIRPKIPIYLGGNTLDLDKWILENLKYYDWYSKLYPNAQILLGNPLKLRLDNADFKQLSSSHHTTDDLRRSAYNNYLYTKDYDARLNDLIYWSEQLKGLDKLTDLQIVDLYNTQAKSIRDAREAPQTYNKTGYSGTNLTFRNMFYNRSMLGTNTPDYNIGYLKDLDNIIGTSTWQRRMDRYENPFEKDTQEGLLNRTFYINIPGTNRLVKVYKKENGDLGLFPNSPNNPPSENPNIIDGGQAIPEDVIILGTDKSKKPGEINPTETKDKESLWSKLGAGLKNVAPDLLDALRLAGNMHNNDRVYNESMKAIRPNLQQSYHTYRLVVGDEATKLAYYRRAVQGQTKAGQPFTADADRLVAYMNEAKRIGDELRAQGDLADNQRIRETSAESAAHTDANRERDTTVANNNATEILKAIAAKHQLTAQKYSADWTNIDLFLLGKLAKLELEKALNKLNERQLALLNMLEDMLGNTTLSNLKIAREKAYDDYINNTDKTKSELLQKIFNEANIKYLKAYIQAQRDAINRYKLYSAKSGAKLTYSDNTDKYLYRTSRDIVEHFRKMSKMTDDSRIKTLPKSVKLTSHPKKRKYLLGGVAPFTIYRPLGVGGETAISTQTSDTGSSKSSKDTAAKDKLDMIKELFKSVQGLPIDASKVYSQISGLLSKYKAFGEEMSTDDIASMYLSAMNQINHLKYSQDAYNKAHAVAVANDSLDEIAVGVNGEMALLNAEGEVTLGTYAKWKESEGKLNPLTNGQLLTMRAHSPNLAFNDEVFDIVNNGIGLTKISAQIKSMAASLGSSTEKIEGITEVESKLVKAGLKILAGTDGTPDGHYLVTTNTKEQSQLVKAALNYIYTMLPKNYKTILALHSGSEENSKALILNFLTSLVNNVIELTITPLTGKASNKEADGDKNMLPSVAFFNGLGEKDSFIILDKTNDGLKIDVVSTPITSKGYNTGSITFNKLESSDFGGQLLMNQATMGDSLISSTGRNNIIIDGRIYQTELPIDQEAKRTTGIIKPDLRFLKKIEAADAELKQMGIDKSDPKNIVTINKVYLENNLPILYTISNNKPTITSEYARFAIVNGVGTEDAFGDSPEFNDAILEISSDKERQLFEAMMQLLRNTKYKLNNGYGIGPISWGETKLYKGTIYIPMVTSNISALAGTGFRAKGEEYNLIEARQLAANAAREMGFNPAGDASNLL